MPERVGMGQRWFDLIPLLSLPLPVEPGRSRVRWAYQRARRGDSGRLRGRRWSSLARPAQPGVKTAGVLAPPVQLGHHHPTESDLPEHGQASQFRPNRFHPLPVQRQVPLLLCQWLGTLGMQCYENQEKLCPKRGWRTQVYFGYR